MIVGYEECLMISNEYFQLELMSWWITPTSQFMSNKKSLKCVKWRGIVNDLHWLMLCVCVYWTSYGSAHDIISSIMMNAAVVCPLNFISCDIHKNKTTHTETCCYSPEIIQLWAQCSEILLKSFDISLTIALFSFSKSVCCQWFAVISLTLVESCLETHLICL